MVWRSMGPDGLGMQLSTVITVITMDHIGYANGWWYHLDA